jgi:hypothetical protein
MNENVVVEGLEEKEGKVNYFIGRDPAQWVTGAGT